MDVNLLLSQRLFSVMGEEGKESSFAPRANEKFEDSPRKAKRRLRKIKRLIVAVVGGTVLLMGLAMVVLPGPATLVIPAGLAILATEFVWAQRLLHRIKEKLADKVVKRRSPNGVEAE